MIDYSEGILNLKRLLADLEEALRDNRVMEARDLCAQITTESRLVYQQLAIQFLKETNHV
jgi:hypothetical protein